MAKQANAAVADPKASDPKASSERPTKVVGATEVKTPTDEVDPATVAKRKMPGRGVRKRVLGSGEGDYCIYQIAPPDSGLPVGSLLPIPNTPRFETTVDALKWIRNESGDILAGKQVMVLRAMEILTIRVESRPMVSIETKPKVVVRDPRKATAEAEDEDVPAEV